MTDTPDESMYRQRHRASGGTVDVRESEELDTDDDVFEIRMPIASTGEVRNEGDEPLTRSELEGMARQLDERSVGVFPAHGEGDMIAFGRYSPFEKLGEWREASYQTRDGDSDLLVATARMPDPETLPATTGDYREALAILKEQAARGIAQDASIGWRDDESFAGGVDLMEASIVGIGADPRTNTNDDAAETTAGVVARAAVSAGADPSELVDAVRDAVDATPDDARPFGPPNGPADKWDDFDACVADVEDWDGIDDPEAACAAWEEASRSRQVVTVNGEDIDLTPPDAVVTAAEEALDAKEEYADDIGDCGTGDGEESARRIIDDDLTADYVADEIAAYLVSHEDDVEGITDPPSDWGRETWTDGCGPVQYALWGGTATGTGVDWATGIANDVADARDEDLPYPNRATDRNLDDPEFGEGDAVSWDWQGDTVHGRVSDVGAEFTVGGNTITGDEGEAVYLIHEWDDDVEAFRRDNVAKPESSLSESSKDMPAAEDGNFESMTETEATADDGGTTEQDAGDGETDATRMPGDVSADDLLTFVAVHLEGMDEGDLAEAIDASDGEYIGEVDLDELFDLVSIVTGAEYGTVADAMEALMDSANEQEHGDKDDDEMDDDEDDEDMNTAADDGEGERDLAAEVESLREQLDELRDGGTPDVDRPESGDGDERDADGEADDADADANDTTGPNWRA